MRAVQILRAGVRRTDHAIHHVTSLAELKHFFCDSRQLVSLPRRQRPVLGQPTHFVGRTGKSAFRPPDSCHIRVR
jgi:hypothetical protein